MQESGGARTRLRRLAGFQQDELQQLFSEIEDRFGGILAIFMLLRFYPKLSWLSRWALGFIVGMSWLVSQVARPIVELPIRDNQFVRAGELLFEVGPPVGRHLEQDAALGLAEHAPGRRQLAVGRHRRDVDVGADREVGADELVVAAQQQLHHLVDDAVGQATIAERVGHRTRCMLHLAHELTSFSGQVRQPIRAKDDENHKDDHNDLREGEAPHLRNGRARRAPS